MPSEKKPAEEKPTTTEKPTDLEEVFEPFTCSICFLLFEEPLVISCGHSFCKRCLQSLKPYQLYCPLCRIPFSSVENLPKNYAVQCWLDNYKNKELSRPEVGNAEKK